MSATLTYNSTLINPQSLNSTFNLTNSNTTSKSQWLIKRLFDAFTQAVNEQSKQSDVPRFRSTSMLSYCISPFAAICMTTATCLNRIVIFAASRRNKKLPWFSMAILRLIALLILFHGSYGLIVALKTYTTSKRLYMIIPNYYKFDKDLFYKYKFFGIKFSSSYFKGILNKKIPIEENSSLSSLSTTLGNSKNILKAFIISIFGSKLSSSFFSNNNNLINSTKLIKYQETTKIIYGPTPNILKPFYLSLCLSQILETFIAVASGYEPTVENGLTLFEYSLAFQEVQSAKRPSIELILISLIALINKSSTHIMGLFNLLEYKLIPSTIISLFGLSLYANILINGKLFVIPFTVVMGYLPQLLVFVIILLCTIIFLTAAIFKGSLKDLAFIEIIENLNSINISLSDDFYTALINIGEFVITTAGEYSYFKEFHSIQLPLKSFSMLKNNKPCSKLKKSKILSSPYSNEYETHPDLINERSKLLNSQAKSWIISKRLQKMKKILSMWTDLCISIIIRKPPLFLQISNDELNEENDSIINDFEFINNNEKENNFIDLEDDDSPDFIGSDSDSGSDDEEEEEEEEIDVEVTNEIQNLGELFTTQDLQSLINPSSIDEIQMSRILGCHLSNNDIITRSKFNNFYNSNKSQVLEDLILEKRYSNENGKFKKSLFGSIFKNKSSLEEEEDGDDEDELYSSLGKCVICHTNSRQIIVWPCRCLSICESCRVSLIVRNFNECVCCRSNVEGYSKVYIP